MNLPPEIEAKVLAQSCSVRSVNMSLLTSAPLGSNCTAAGVPRQSKSSAPASRSKKKSKYKNKKTKVGELTFDSKKEAKRWLELCRLQRMGKILLLRRQVIFRIFVRGKRVCNFVADFVYVESGQRVVEDVKSPFTRKMRVYRLKKKLMSAAMGVAIKET